LTQGQREYQNLTSFINAEKAKQFQLIRGIYDLPSAQGRPFGMDLFGSEAFSDLVRELMGRHHVPGVAIAAVQDEEVASAGYGHACLETSTPCTGSTLFDIASSAKSLTAAAVGILVADNDKYPEVQYEAAMSSLLPDDFVMQGVGYTEGVTVEDVLSHRTGMAR
jgi:CubicO group peptidase (beta-lactamase class C family)